MYILRKGRQSGGSYLVRRAGQGEHGTCHHISIPELALVYLRYSLSGDLGDNGVIVRLWVSHRISEAEASYASILATLLVADLINNKQRIDLISISVLEAILEGWFGLTKSHVVLNCS